MTDGFKALRVRQVANGFMVTPESGRDDFVASDQMHVFQSFAELVGWLEGHLDHRADWLRTDKPQLGEAPTMESLLEKHRPHASGSSIVGGVVGETDYLMSGANGDRLKDSAAQIRGTAEKRTYPVVRGLFELHDDGSVLHKSAYGWEKKGYPGEKYLHSGNSPMVVFPGLSYFD